MTENVFTLSILRGQEKKQASDARISTMANEGEDARYHDLETGLDQYSLDLFGDKGKLEELVRIGISKAKERPFRMLILGAGSGRMAEELIEKVGQLDRLQIVEIGIGDPRNTEQREFDEKNNIEFIDGDINEVKIDSNSYDLVVSRSFMLHMNDPLRIIKKVSRSMREKGEFYADFSLRDQLKTKFRRTNDLSSEMQAIRIIDDARSNGAEIFIDNVGLYYRKNENPLKFENIGYAIDDKGRMFYKIK